MAVVKSLQFKDSRGVSRDIDFLSTDAEIRKTSFETTIFTGRNGSHKSSLLKALVAALTLPDSESRLELRDADGGPYHVLCMSGSVADRFPAKELPAGIHSHFDVPSYSYLGQRAGPNILSKKAPVQTMLGFALDPANSSRFASGFFSRAHHVAGIQPRVEFVFQRRQSRLERDSLDLLSRVRRKTPATDSARRPIGAPKGEEGAPYISYATAQWLLGEFTADDFNTLESVLKKSGRRVKANFTSEGAISSECEPNILRLGLLTGLFGLIDATVFPVHGGGEFSLFELSSGEYQMYTSILGLGFGVTGTSIVLIDEPENSLHPQWQRDFMQTVIEICNETLVNGHLVVCTHSPLIVSTTLEGATVVDLSNDQSQMSTSYFGASSDELLLSQFGVGSSRNRVVVEAVQRAVSLVESGDFENLEFQSLHPKLQQILSFLSPEDPLVDVIHALLDDGVES